MSAPPSLRRAVAVRNCFSSATSSSTTQDPSLRLPRGVIAGAVLAMFMIVPLVAAIALDAGFRRHGRKGTSKPASGVHAIMTAPIASTRGEFFDGKVLVQVYVSRPTSTEKSQQVPSFAGKSTATPAAKITKRDQLEVRLENRSPSTVELDVLQVSSTKGDVDAGMHQLKLAPGQTLQTGTLLSPTFASTDGTPVTVTMRLGNRLETQDLVPPVTPSLRRD